MYGRKNTERQLVLPPACWSFPSSFNCREPLRWNHKSLKIPQICFSLASKIIPEINTDGINNMRTRKQQKHLKSSLEFIGGFAKTIIFEGFQFPWGHPAFFSISMGFSIKPPFGVPWKSLRSERTAPGETPLLKLTGSILPVGYHSICNRKTIPREHTLWL